MKVAELRKVLCGWRGGRIVSEGHDTVFVYFGCEFAAPYSNTYMKGYGHIVKVGTVTGRTGRPNMVCGRQRVNSRLDVLKLSESFALGHYRTQICIKV